MSAMHLLAADRKRFTAIKPINEFLVLFRVKIEIHGLLISLFARLYYGLQRYHLILITLFIQSIKSGLLGIN